MYYVIFSFISCLVIGSTLSIENSVSTYNSKVCNNEPTCNLINEPYLSETHRTLAGRDCMCDSDCVDYGDCCADSEFFAHSSNGSGKSYSCSPDSQIYMIANCPAGYSNQAILSKCLASLKPLDGPDNSVIRPATNTKTRTTYGNIYCASCNNDFNVALWNLSSRCGEVPVGYFDSQTRTPTASETNKEISQPPEISTKPPKVEISTTSENPKVTSTTASTKTSKPLISVNLGLKPSIEINIRNKTYKPSLNLFRQKRQQPGIDFNKYRKDWDNILENVHYDANTHRYISQYNGKSFICEFISPLPKGFETYVRKCVPNLVSSCPPNTDQETAQKCSSSTAIVHNKNSEKAYKNKDCAKCNNDVKELTGCPQGQRASGSELFSTSDKGSTPPCNQPEIQNSPLCQAG